MAYQQQHLDEEKPMTAPPTSEPTSQQPTAQQPTAQQPASQHPTSQQPTVQQPASQQPTAYQQEQQLEEGKYNTAQPTAVYLQQPVMQNVDHNGVQLGSWRSGVFDCFDSLLPNCLMTWLCPCVTHAQIVSRMGWFDYQTALIVLILIRILAYAFGVGFIIVFIFLFIQRMKFREIFKIPGSMLEDCCFSFWCSCCTLSQMATHVGSYKDGECSFSKPETLAGYPHVV